MIPLSENALKVLESRYLRKNLRGELVETPDELFMRVANAVAEQNWNGEPKTR